MYRESVHPERLIVNHRPYCSGCKFSSGSPLIAPTTLAALQELASASRHSSGSLDPLGSCVSLCAAIPSGAGHGHPGDWDDRPRCRQLR